MDGYQKFFTTRDSCEYFFGLMISDGHLGKLKGNKGRIAIELKKEDSKILHCLQSHIIPYSSIRRRERSSNFSKHFISETLGVYDFCFREFINKNGIPYGSKKNVEIPDWAVELPNFWRGVIDGDGSLGITSEGKCFVSFVTKSEYVANSFRELLLNTSGVDRTIKRNSRDAIFNLMIYNEEAQKLVKFLNYDSKLCIDRKKIMAHRVLSWVRPDGMRKRTWAIKRWTKDQDEFILNHSVEESMKHLDRTEQSVKMRIWRIAP
jgi:hypothetical protein